MYKTLVRTSPFLLAALSVSVGYSAPHKKIPILSDPALLKQAKVNVLKTEDDVGVAYTEVTEHELMRITRAAHENGKCGGYMRLSQKQFPESKLKNLKNEKLRADTYLAKPRLLKIEKKEQIEKAVALVSDQSLLQFNTWFSSYPTRFNRNASSATPVTALKDKIAELILKSPHSWVKERAKVAFVAHQKTPQNSVHLRIEGKLRPNEMVVLGGHLDSISWNGQAPGADDNASGSSNVFEAAKVILSQLEAPDRSLDFYWYAGEESGLLGSNEIAESYRAAGKDVVAVMQLDMTLFAGSGEGTIASMTDFTSPWLRALLVELNRNYVGANIIDDKCGYGCSDHASWHSEGYPTVMPFEAGFDNMNGRIHSNKDVIDGQSNFKHSALFGKLAVSFMMELGNSNLRQP